MAMADENVRMKFNRSHYTSVWTNACVPSRLYQYLRKNSLLILIKIKDEMDTLEVMYDRFWVDAE